MSKEKTTVQVNGCAWIILVWILAALAFCGDPDLHDALVDRVQMSESEHE